MNCRNSEFKIPHAHPHFTGKGVRTKPHTVCQVPKSNLFALYQRPCKVTLEQCIGRRRQFRQETKEAAITGVQERSFGGILRIWAPERGGVGDWGGSGKGGAYEVPSLLQGVESITCSFTLEMQGIWFHSRQIQKAWSQLMHLCSDYDLWALLTPLQYCAFSSKKRPEITQSSPGTVPLRGQ